MSEPHTPPINTDEGILDFLSRTFQLRCLSVERLSGGNTNHVWRIITADDEDTGKPSSTIVVKHAQESSRTNSSLVLPTIRMDFEARVMRLVPSLMADGPNNASAGVYNVGTPRVVEYDSASHVLVLGDGGRSTLKEAYAALGAARVRSIGVRLAKWLARLHGRSTTTDIGPKGNAVARTLYRYSYQNLQGALVGYGLGGPGGELGKTVDDMFGPMLQTDDECVAHGDFWPGNMLVEDGGDEDAEVVVTIVDWELTRRGIGATDVAQFVAEAYLLDRFRSVSHGLAATFLRSYIAETSPSKQFWTRFAVHWATHVCFWPTYVKWASTEEMQKVAALGVKVIEMALSGEERLPDFLLAHFDNATQAL